MCWRLLRAKGNLIVRLRGSSAPKPVLVLAHLDVVEAKREDWSVDSFHFLERDGHFYGRGTFDNKAGACSVVFRQAKRATGACGQVPVVPMLETGGTDGRLLRAAGIPTYGVSGLFDDIDYVRAHGRDERIGVQVFYDGLEFQYPLLKILVSH